MKRIKFQTRINIVFIVGLFTLLWGAFMLYKMNNLNNNLEKFYNHPFVVLNSVSELKDNISNINNWTEHYINSDFEIRKDFYDLIKSDDSLAFNSIKIIDTYYLGKQSDIDSLTASYEDYSKFINHVLELKSGDYKFKGDSLFNQSGILKSNHLLVQVKTISNFSKKMADTLYLNTIENGKERIKYFWFVIAFLIVLNLFLSYFISRSIARPVKKVVDDLRKLYKKDHTLDNTSSEEEILTKTVNELTKAYEKLNNFNVTLEKKVQERTIELKESEGKFKSLFEKSSEALLIIKNEVFVDCNLATIVMLGYKSKNEFLHTHPSQLSPKNQPDGKDSFNKAQEKMIMALNEGSQRFEWTHKRSNGQEFPVEVVLTTISNKSDERIIYCVWRDITERKEAETELLESKNRAEHDKNYLENIINKVGDPVFVKDEESRLLVVNEAFCDVFKLRRELIIGKTLAENVSPEERESFLKIDKQVLATGIENINEETLTLDDEETKIISTRKTRYVNKKGEKFLIGVIRDITERKNIELELIKSKERAEESDRLKSAFLANMSHEVRTPMNAILGFSSLLKDSKLNNQKRIQFINLIEDSSKRLLIIITAILDVSKIHSKQLSVNLDYYNLNEILDNLFLQFSIQFPSDKVELKISKALEDHECIIKTDKERLQQVISNLIENALKFTKIGSVTFGYTIDSEMIRFFVEDTGSGINIKDKERIFDRFFQSKNEILETAKGTGLGLAIAKGIVELMGGNIWVDETSPAGTKFLFTMPFLPVEKVKTHKTTKHQNIVNMKNTNITVLVAEDEITNFIYLREVLKPFHFNILHAKNGLEAITLFNNNQEDINLVLMDVKMPIMDGYEATIEIRKVTKTLPIIAITAYAMADEESLAIKNGCNQYLSKPVSKQSLYDIVFNYLNIQYLE